MPSGQVLTLQIRDKLMVAFEVICHPWLAQRVSFCLKQSNLCCKLTETGSLKCEGSQDGHRDQSVGLQRWGRLRALEMVSGRWEHGDANGKHLSSVPPLPPPGIDLPPCGFCLAPWRLRAQLTRPARACVQPAHQGRPGDCGARQGTGFP